MEHKKTKGLKTWYKICQIAKTIFCLKMCADVLAADETMWSFLTNDNMGSNWDYCSVKKKVEGNWSQWYQFYNTLHTRGTVSQKI